MEALTAELASNIPNLIAFIVLVRILSDHQNKNHERQVELIAKILEKVK